MIFIIILEVVKWLTLNLRKKRILVNAKRARKNKAINQKLRTIDQKVETAIAAGDKELAKENLTVAVSEIDKACSKVLFIRTQLQEKCPA